MAERRMFAKTIVTSDAFLDMPPTARCLYFTLGMFADDDGFVNNPKSIMRQVGSTSDDINILIAKKFLLAFDSGVIVIKHWRIHNYIRGDRKHDTKYIEEMSSMCIDDNGAYTLNQDKYPPLGVACPTGDRQVSVNRQAGDIPRLGKDSIGKDSIDIESSTKRFTPPSVEEVREYIQGNGYNVDADNFVDFYESKGWLVGKNKMKDWKAAVRTWARRNNGTDFGTSNTERNRIRGANAGSGEGASADSEGTRRNFIPMAEMPAEME